MAMLLTNPDSTKFTQRVKTAMMPVLLRHFNISENDEKAVYVLEFYLAGRFMGLGLAARRNLELTETMRLTALCGLGHSTAVPVQTSIQNFRKEYLAHIDRDYCPVCAQAAVAEGIYEAEEDYRNDGNSRMGRRRAAVGERDVMYDSYDAYARHRSRGTSYAGRFERRGGREA